MRRAGEETDKVGDMAVANNAAAAAAARVNDFFNGDGNGAAWTFQLELRLPTKAAADLTAQASPSASSVNVSFGSFGSFAAALSESSSLAPAPSALTVSESSASTISFGPFAAVPTPSLESALESALSSAAAPPAVVMAVGSPARLTKEAFANALSALFAAYKAATGNDMCEVARVHNANHVMALNECATKLQLAWTTRVRLTSRVGIETDWLRTANKASLDPGVYLEVAAVLAAAPATKSAPAYKAPLAAVNELVAQGVFETAETKTTQVSPTGVPYFKSIVTGRVRIRRAIPMLAAQAGDVDVQVVVGRAEAPVKAWAEHAASLELLKEASVYNDDAWEACDASSPMTLTVRRGDDFYAAESDLVELKGDAADAVLDLERALAHIIDPSGKTFQSKGLGPYVVGFLNAQGGEYIVGVSDSGKIQGVRLGQKDLDVLGQRISQILVKVEPTCLRHVNVRYQPVLDATNQHLYLIKVAAVRPSNLAVNARFTYDGKVYTRILTTTRNITGLRESYILETAS